MYLNAISKSFLIPLTIKDSSISLRTKLTIRTCCHYLMKSLEVLAQVLEHNLNFNYSIFESKIERERERERERAAFGCSGVGIPIGNLTSQLFANVYMNEFDQFIKHNLRIKYYLRYCDDFVILSNNEDQLKKVIIVIEKFLNENLKLRLHENKVCIRKLKQGIDFLGYVILPHHTVLRTKTRRRMLKKLTRENSSSYMGILGHCDSYELQKQICNIIRNLG